MCQRLGVEVAEEVCNRFGKMLAGKVRHEDSLGHYGMGQFAVVSPGTAPAFCATFAERVREAVEMAKLTIRGETVALTVSIGLASTPSDTVPFCRCLARSGRRTNAFEPWLPAAIARKPAACGRPRGPYRSITPWSCWPPGAVEPVVPHLPALLERLLPMLQLMDKELGLALPLAEIERRLSDGNHKTISPFSFCSAGKPFLEGLYGDVQGVSPVFHRKAE
jgi:two-component system cell cycle response regulator